MDKFEYYKHCKTISTHEFEFVCLLISILGRIINNSTHHYSFISASFNEVFKLTNYHQSINKFFQITFLINNPTTETHISFLVLPNSME